MQCVIHEKINKDNKQRHKKDFSYWLARKMQSIEMLD